MLCTNFWCALLLHKSLKNANSNPILTLTLTLNSNPNPSLNCNCEQKTVILILSTKSYYITREMFAPDECECKA